MSKIIIVSNRLPIELSKKEDSDWNFIPTSGGLATGMKSVHDHGESLWIGWLGVSSEEITKPEFDDLTKQLVSQKYKPISLSQNEIDEFYLGFSNQAIWPLFHYFKQFFKFENEQWENYVSVNQKYADSILEEIDDGDKIWIHDYQLLLVPKMIKSVKKNITIGFFLHIPFPSFEIFRLFPKREELLNGILGADLIGFHTYDYQRHFLSSVRRILHLNVSFNLIEKFDRKIIVNTFPMGIDYEKFERTSIEHKKIDKKKYSQLRTQLEKHKLNNQGKIILSIDRLDYTKGIVNRIKSFELFLDKYPQYQNKLRLLMVCVPSRSKVSDYMRLKREIDETIGRVNGKFANVNWTPIWYYYRSFGFDDLIDLYTQSDIAMVTPLRDGMNLVAKEYLATRVENDGVLILSELAGASKELHQALIVNPFDINELADSIYEAIKLSKQDQIEKNIELRERVKRYNVNYWSTNFIQKLNEISKITAKNKSIKLDQKTTSFLNSSYLKSKKRLIILDYDGTLVGFNNDRNKALPSIELKSLLRSLSKNEKNKVAIISGRPHDFMEKNLSDLGICLIAEHGFFQKNPGCEWEKKQIQNNTWVDHIFPLLQQFADNTPGTFVEKKVNALVWHYRRTDPELGIVKAEELKTILSSMISPEFNVVHGNKIVEVVSSSTNKGIASLDLFKEDDFDFTFVAGDDTTDENMFIHLPKDVFSVKVGNKLTSAKYFVNEHTDILKILKLIEDK